MMRFMRRHEAQTSPGRSWLFFVVSFFSAPAIMMLGVQIDVSAPDQGLNQILQASAVHDPVKVYFQQTCQLANTTDLLNYFSKSTFEQEVADVLKSKFPVQENVLTAEIQRLYIARTRAAYRMASEVNERIATEAAKPKDDAVHPDLERPLDKATIENLDKQWDDVHPFKFITQMRPAPPFRNRIFREFRALSCKLIPVEKARSLDDHKSTTDPVELPIGGCPGRRRQADL